MNLANQTLISKVGQVLKMHPDSQFIFQHFDWDNLPIIRHDVKLTNDCQNALMFHSLLPKWSRLEIDYTLTTIRNYSRQIVALTFPDSKVIQVTKHSYHKDSFDSHLDIPSLVIKVRSTVSFYTEFSEKGVNVSHTMTKGINGFAEKRSP